MRSIEQLVKEGQAAAEDARHWTERRAERLDCKHAGVLWEREDGECALWRSSEPDGAWLAMRTFDEDVFIGADEFDAVAAALTKGCAASPPVQGHCDG